MSRTDLLQRALVDSLAEFNRGSLEAAHLGTLYGALKTSRLLFVGGELSRFSSKLGVELGEFVYRSEALGLVRRMHFALRSRRRELVREVRNASRACRELRRQKKRSAGSDGNFWAGAATVGGGCKCPGRPNCLHHAQLQGQGFSMRRSAPVRVKKEKSERLRRSQQFQFRHS